MPEVPEMVEVDLYDVVGETDDDKSGIGEVTQLKSFPTGKYIFTCQPEYQARQNTEDADKNPGRLEVTFQMKPEEGKSFWLRISPQKAIRYDLDGDVVYREDENGEPTETPITFSDARHKNYSRMLVALNQQDPSYRITDLVEAAVNTSFQISLVEYVGEMKVGDIPTEKDKNYWMNTRELGEEQTIMFRVPNDEDVRAQVASLGYDGLNYVEAIRLA